MEPQEAVEESAVFDLQGVNEEDIDMSSNFLTNVLADQPIPLASFESAANPGPADMEDGGDYELQPWV